jgi:hypothetical protein
MSIRATARTAARAAFKAAGDSLIKVQVFLGPQDDAYDAENDTTERSWAQITPQVDALAYQAKKSRRSDDKSVEPADPEKTTKSFVVLGTSLSIADIDQEGEILEVKTGAVHQIAEIESDPTGAVFIFHTTA